MKRIFRAKRQTEAATGSGNRNGNLKRKKGSQQWTLTMFWVSAIRIIGRNAYSPRPIFCEGGQ